MIYNIDKLAKKAGVTRRTVRYYIQRGLLSPPEGEKRGSYYTDEHLDRLKAIQRLSDQGIPLIHMKKMLDGEQVKSYIENLVDQECAEDDQMQESDIEEKTVEICTDWKRLLISEGIELHFQSGKIDSEQLQKIISIVKNKSTI